MIETIQLILDEFNKDKKLDPDGKYYEVINMAFKLSNENIDKIAIRGDYLKLFYEKAGIDYEKKLDTEIDHYEKLSADMKHQIHKNKFFFGQGASSRKNVVLNDDCISLIQYMKRRDKLYVNVYMRSTHLIQLFFMDLHNICKMVKSLIIRHNLCIDDVELCMIVANMHINKKDVKTLTELIKYFKA